MKKITLSFLFGLFSFLGFSQIGLVENFDGDVFLPAAWSETGGYSIAFVEVCNGFSVRANLDSTTTTNSLTSPNVVGMSNGSDLTIAFDYKIVDWAAAADATPPGWGNLEVQYSTNDGVVWTTIGTIDDINHVTSNTCANTSFIVPAANLPTGSDFRFQFVGNWAQGTFYAYIDNINASQVVVTPPDCVSLISPSNGATGVGLDEDLTWSAATGLPTGYTVSVGTTPGGTDIVNAVDTSLSTVYDLPTLDYSTTYYVTITPYNANGDAINCTEESFTTGADPNAPVDCSTGIPINTVFCYDNNDTTTFSFISSDGSPLVVVFNSGTTENNFDELIVLDSDGVTNLNAATPYGAGGNLATLMFTSTGDSITIGVTSDGSVIACGTDPWDFDVFCVDTTALPNCNSRITSPANGETDVNENTTITWSAASVFVTGYTISIGTTPGGTDIANAVDVGAVLTYNPGALAFSTIYYVTIIPYNTNGDATGCIEESFTTRNDPNQIIDCSTSQVINTTYCYTNNDTMQFNFASNDGSPLVVIFNSGTTENNFDELIILDSDGVTDLNAGTPYGAGGDLTGIMYTSTGSSLTIGVTSDGSVISCTGDPWDFDVSCVDTTALPNCNADLSSPTNGETGVNENATINWNAATVFVTGYTISIGTTPGGTDIENNTDIGNVTTYTPIAPLSASTTYYVTIIPYNTNGSATGCIEESFSTRDIPTPPVGVTCSSGSSSFIFTEDFETDPAAGWTGTTFSGNNGDWRITAGNGNSFGTGPFVSFNGGMHLEYEASGNSSTIASAVSPAIDLTTAVDAAELSFYFHAFGADIGTLNVGIGTTAAGPFTNIFSTGGEFHPSDTDPWTPVGLDLTPFLGGPIFIEFSYGGTGNGFEGDLSIDFVRVETCGSFCIAPSDITVTNIFETTADVSWTANSGETAWEYVVQPAGTGVPGGAGTATTTSTINETGLTGSTTYEVYVRADCGVDGQSLWAGPINFTTLNTPPPPPVGVNCTSGTSSFIFTEDFETDPAAGWTGTAFSGNNGDWRITVGNANSGGTGPFASFNGGMHLEYEASGNATAIANAISPVIDLTPAVDGAELSFNMHAFGADMGTLNVGIGTSPTGPFTNVYSWIGDYQTSDTEAWVPIGVNLDAYLGQAIYIQFSYGGAGTGFEGDLSIDFVRIEACGSFCIAPSDLMVSGITDTTADLAWTANSGETAWEYVVQPAGTGEPTGAGIATTTNPVTATGLMDSTAYEVYVRADCGVDGQSLWTGPINFFTQFTPLPPENCPILYAGDDVTIDCANPSTDLTATFQVYGQDTTSYELNALSCPTPPTTGGTPTSLAIDDTWSDVIDMTFEFCFFGVTYNQIVVGSNGVLTFDVANAGNFNGWNIDPGDTLPNNTNNTLAEANIFGVAHDIDPGVCGDINYIIAGTAPSRQFIVNYTDVCHFSAACNNLLSSSQIILYESSNAIDINIFDKPICTTWNDGNAVVGVQNPAGTIAFTPPGRNTGVWTATNEFWRFTPSQGAPDYTFEWLDGTTSLGNTETITVSPTATTTYTASITYNLCSGGTATITDDVVVTFDGSLVDDASFTMTATCDGGTATVTGTTGGTFALNPVPTDGATIDTATGTITGGSSNTMYTVEYTTAGVCPATSTQTVTTLTTDDASFTMTATCDGGTATVTGTTGGTFALNPVPTDGATIDTATGTITGGSSNTMYTVEYTTAGVCPATSTQTVTTLTTDDASFTMTATCDGGTATVTGTTGGTFALNPVPTDGATIDTATGTITGGSSNTMYTVEYTTAGVCPATSTQTVTTLTTDDASFTMTATCDGGTATVTGTTGGTFALNPVPTDGATIDTATGTITGGSSNTMYTVEYTTAGVCPATSTQTVTTLTTDDASFTMTATCDGGTATVTGTTGGTFALNPVPTDGATIDTATGTITGGSSNTMYTVEYTTAGVCPATSTQTVTTLTTDDASFTMTATCDGGTATVTGTTGGTFALNPVPTDGATIDTATGTITGGSSNTMYTVEYTTAGVCPATSTQTVTTLTTDDASFTMTATCDGGTATVTGTTGGTFALNPVPTDGATIDTATGTITGGSSNTMYTVEYTTAGVCPATSTQTVTTLTTDDASFTMTATCDGGTATVTGTTGGAFDLNPTPTDGATIDTASGTITGGSAGTSYTVEYITAGVCPATSTQTVTTLTNAFSYEIVGECSGSNFELTITPLNGSFDPAIATYTLYDDMNTLLQTNPSGDNVFNISSIFPNSLSSTSYNFVVEVIDVNGCRVSMPILVDSIICIFPQAISPNGDMYNQSFDLSNYNVQSLEIFNRNGTKVYSKTNYTNEWEGQSDAGDQLPVGTYFYIMKYQGDQVRTSWVYINREN